MFAKDDFEITLNSRALRISHLVICLKKPSSSSSLRKRVLTKSSGSLRFTAGTRCAAGVVLWATYYELVDSEVDNAPG